MNHGRHGGGERRCYKCGKEGHIARQCGASGRICFQCGRVGHTRRDCPAHPSGQITRRERTKNEGTVGTAFGGGERPCGGLSGRRDEENSQTVRQPESSTSPSPRPSPRGETPPIYRDGSTAERQPMAMTKESKPSDANTHPHPTQTPSLIPSTDRLQYPHGEDLDTTSNLRCERVNWERDYQTPSQVTSPKQKRPSQPERVCSGPRSREGYRQPAPPTCFHCNTPGHIKRECPLLTRNNELDHPRDGSQRAVRDGKDSVKSQGGRPHHTPLLDSHCHLEYVFEKYSHCGSFQAFMHENNFPGAFEGCITTFCDPAAFSASLGLWKDLLAESNVWGTFGIHPHNAKYYCPRLEDGLLKCLEHPKCVAFGEIGLDYSSHSASDPDTQKHVLEHQLSLAVSYGKPILLHCRDAEDDLLPILTSKVPSDWKIHLHCYTGPLDTATEFLTAFPNLFIGVTGNVTFAWAKNVREVACSVPLDRLLLETDAPYCLPGHLLRSQRSRYSHPGMVLHVGREVARVRGVGLREVLEAARKNVTAVYGI